MFVNFKPFNSKFSASRPGRKLCPNFRLGAAIFPVAWFTTTPRAVRLARAHYSLFTSGSEHCIYGIGFGLAISLIVYLFFCSFFIVYNLFSCAFIVYLFIIVIDGPSVCSPFPPLIVSLFFNYLVLSIHRSQ